MRLLVSLQSVTEITECRTIHNGLREGKMNSCIETLDQGIAFLPVLQGICEFHQAISTHAFCKDGSLLSGNMGDELLVDFNYLFLSGRLTQSF
jgi:hypothetical protein